jgi:anti-sigma regulatory factor (Ser/Thr protein kinase)
MSARPNPPTPDELAAAVVVELPFGHTTVAPGFARRALRPLLEPADPALAADVELVVSELVSNVVRHTHDGGVLRAWVSDGAVRVEVADVDQRLPAVHVTAPSEPGGRGLLMVDRVADVWGVEAEPTGKRVWAVIRPPQIGLPTS